MQHKNVAFLATDKTDALRYSKVMLHQWLKNALAISNLSQAEMARRLSDRLGRTYDRSMINKMTKEGGRDISGEEVIAIAAITGVSMPVFMEGAEDEEALGDSSPLPIVGETAAGLWREHDENEPMVQDFERLPGILVKEYEKSTFGLRVKGTSMNLAGINDGDVIVVKSIWNDPHLKSGDIVVVKRRQGHLTETTVKELQVHPDKYELWPRSSDPKFKEPIRYERSSHLAEDGSTVEIVGKVIYSIKPFISM